MNVKVNVWCSGGNIEQPIIPLNSPCITEPLLKRTIDVHLLLNQGFGSGSGCCIDIRHTICPEISNPFHIVTYHMRLVITSWTHSIQYQKYQTYFKAVN